MVNRTGYGKGKGMGYFNLLTIDPYVHSLSARGVKSKIHNSHNNYILSAKTKIPDYVPADFGDVPTYKKRGLIKEIARKVADGVHWAVEWEKKHLPEQKSWVKTQYDKAKDLIEKAKSKNAEEKARAKAEIEKQKDLADVRDELDVDDDGTQDIDIDELDDVNYNIRGDLDNIDIDNNGVPDYIETEPLDEPIYEKTHVGQKSAGTPLNYLFTQGKEFAQKEYKAGKEFVQKKIEEHEHTIEELRGMSNSELKERSLRTQPSLFGGKDIYEKELLRRVTKEKQVDVDVQQAMRKPVVSAGGSGFGDMFGFLNPLSTLSQRDTAPSSKRAIAQSGISAQLGDTFGFINPLYLINQKVK